MGLISLKYTIVQLPRMMDVIATRLERAPVDMPVMPWPRLQPPAMTAPIPIRMLPKNTVRNSFAGGIFHLNSLRLRALNHAPKGTERMKNMPQEPRKMPRKLNSGKLECVLLVRRTLKSSRIGPLTAMPRGAPPKEDDTHQATMVSTPIARPVVPQAKPFDFDLNSGLPANTKVSTPAEKIAMVSHFIAGPPPKRSQSAGLDVPFISTLNPFR